MESIAKKQKKVREAQRAREIKARNAYLEMVQEERINKRRRDKEDLQRSPKQYKENNRKLSLQMKRDEENMLQQASEYLSIRHSLKKVEDKILNGLVRSLNNKQQASLKFKTRYSQSFSRVDDNRSSQQEQDLKNNSKLLEDIADRFKKATENLRSMSNQRKEDLNEQLKLAKEQMEKN